MDCAAVDSFENIEEEEEFDDDYDESGDDESFSESEDFITRLTSATDLLSFLEQPAPSPTPENIKSLPLDVDICDPLPPIPVPSIFQEENSEKNQKYGSTNSVYSYTDDPDKQVSFAWDNIDDNINYLRIPSETEIGSVIEDRNIIKHNHHDTLASSEDGPDIPSEEEKQVKKAIPTPPSNWKSSVCSICYEEMDGKLPCVLECGHFFCLHCLEHFMRVTMDSGQLDLLVCPELFCGIPLSTFDVGCILPPEEYKRYLKIKDSSYAKRNEGEVWCPKLDCSGCASVGDAKYLTCTTCYHEFCKKCRNPRHEGKSCRNAKAKSKKENKQIDKENRKSRKREKSTKKWAAKNTKPCPRCGEVIQKNGGCHHVACTTCHFEFCWQCGAEADGPFHCKGKKVLTVVGAVIFSPVLIAGGAIAGGAYLIESRVIKKDRPRSDCITYEPVNKLAEKASLELYWILD